MPIQDVEERRRGWGGCWRNARTFTAATFFAHLLTLRMFGVYFFNPVTLRKDKKRKNEEGDKRHFLLVFTPSSCFFYISFLYVCLFVFVLTVTPAWNRVIPHWEGCWRALCLESSRLPLPSSLQKLKNKTRKTNDRGVRVDMNNATTGSLSFTLLTLVLKPSQWMYYCAPC